MVWAYYNVGGVQEWAQGVGEAKVRAGLWAAFLAGALAGGVVAEAAKIATGRAKLDFGRVLWVGFVYGVVGVFVDLLYRFQAERFGHGTDLWTLSTKVAVDMFIFTPFISFPFATAMFGWWKAGFRATFWKRALTWAFYRDEVAPTMPMGWAFWVPMVYLAYSLPLPLQFPFSMLAEAAWCVLFVFMVAGE